MRAIFILLSIANFELFGCAPIEVVKELSKVSQSIESSVKGTKKQNNEEIKKNETINEEKINIINEEKNDEEVFLKEKKEVDVEKLNKKKLVSKQKTINVACFGGV